ncbi:MAG: hypothetical protein Q9195_008386 [Heterodermia aff. obscurata]
MPPKRRPPPPPPSTEKKPRQSKLAKENNISATTESEIREAFHLFSTPEETLPAPSLRRALTALGVAPSSAAELHELLDTVDPGGSGSIEYEHFVAIAALKLQNRSEEDISAEVEAAFRLFVSGDRGKGHQGGGAAEEKITVGTLRRVARELKMEGEVGEGVLKDMILEANGGAGVGAGVGRGDFEGVMRRAGVFK